MFSSLPKELVIGILKYVDNNIKICHDFYQHRTKLEDVCMLFKEIVNTEYFIELQKSCRIYSYDIEKYKYIINDEYSKYCNPIREKYDKSTYVIKKYIFDVWHDGGYDEYGPISNICDFYIVYLNKKDNKIYEDYWHTEEWFLYSYTSEFELIETNIYSLSI